MKLPNLDEQKAAQRTQCYARRLAIQGDQAEAAALTIAAKVSDMVAIHDGTIVSAYWPLPGELDPRPALLALVQRGAAGALPRTVGDGRPLDFHAWQPGDPLVEGRFKVMEPSADTAIVVPTVLLVPLLAFDHQCHRLGHGKGYYDRTLQRLRTANPTLLTIGVAFAAQEVERVPTDDFDQRLDMVVTEQAIHKGTT